MRTKDAPFQNIYALEGKGDISQVINMLKIPWMVKNSRNEHNIITENIGHMSQKDEIGLKKF